MLTIRIVNLFSRFTRPSVSKYQSVVQLTNDKSVILKMVDNMNRKCQQSTVENPHYSLEHVLKFKPQTIKQIKQNVEYNAYSPINHKKHKIRMNIISGEKQYDFLKDDIEDPYTLDLRPIQRHFSLSQKEVPIIDQYQIDSKSIMLFNLPDNVSQKDIHESLHNFKIKSIKIDYCLLGLPAYARVQLQSESEVEDLKSSQRQYVEIGDRFCYIHTNQDNERLRLPNRMMVLHDLPQTETESIFLQLTKYGRIMYFDHPSIIRKQLSLSEVKSIYANSNNPVKINVHKKDGTIESEYYPAEGQIQQINPFDNGFSENYFDFSKASSQRFERKLQFAENINVYENAVGEIQIVPRGYLIVTFSCAQEAQNCYFALKNSVKIDLLKSRYEFHFDRQFKQRLLRFIDNEFLKKRINEKEDEVDLIKFQYKFGLSMMDQLVEEQFIEKGQYRYQPQEDNENDDSYAYKDYYNRLVELKKTIGKRTPHGKSFDELAQMELYGRVLPKYDPRQTLDLYNLDEKKPEHFSNMENPRLKGIPESRVLQAKQLRIIRKKTRTEKQFLKEPIGQQHIQGTALIEGEPEGELDLHQIQQEPQQEDLKGKRRFSTFKTMPKVRNMTLEEIAYRSMKFNQFVRDTINEFLGIFSEQKLESNFSNDETKLINPHRVTFTDKTQFLTENQIPRVLEHHRNPDQAQMIFENHVQTLQIINSKQLNVDQVILKDINKQSTLSQIHLTDTGVVDELFQVDISQGETVDEFIRKLNAVEASFGEQYRKVEKDGSQYVAKIKKLEHIYPLDRIKNIQQFIQQAEGLARSEPDKVALLTKHFDRILSKGEIPEQVRQAFNHQESSLDMDELFTSVGIEKGIWKKGKFLINLDLQMLMNLQKYREKDIQQDIAGQIKMEKMRRKQRPVKGTDYAKDPDNIDIRGEDGEFEVSKFKQV